MDQAAGAGRQEQELIQGFSLDGLADASPMDQAASLGRQEQELIQGFSLDGSLTRALWIKQRALVDKSKN
jgi:hypothetical protein